MKRRDFLFLGSAGAALALTGLRPRGGDAPVGLLPTDGERWTPAEAGTGSSSFPASGAVRLTLHGLAGDTDGLDGAALEVLHPALGGRAQRLWGLQRERGVLSVGAGTRAQVPLAADGSLSLVVHHQPAGRAARALPVRLGPGGLALREGLYALPLGDAPRWRGLELVSGAPHGDEAIELAEAGTPLRRPMLLLSVAALESSRRTLV